MFEKMAKPFVNTLIFQDIIKIKVYLCCDRLGGGVLSEFPCSPFETPEPDFLLLALHQSLNTKCHQMHSLRAVPDPLFRELQVDCYLVVVCCHLGMVPVLYQWSFLFLASSYNLPLAIINKEFFFSVFCWCMCSIIFCLISVNCIIVSWRHTVAFWSWSFILMIF